VEVEVGVGGFFKGQVEELLDQMTDAMQRGNSRICQVFT
jgi:hypothetical protein